LSFDERTPAAPKSKRLPSVPNPIPSLAGRWQTLITTERLRLFLFESFLIVAFVGASSCLWAQSSTTGGLRGTVVDPKGAVVPGVIVVLSNAGTGQAQMAMTDANGLYGFSLLPPGTYDVIFSGQGFKISVAMSVVVNVSEAPEMDAQLEAGTSDERVSCQCRLSQTATSSSGTLVDSKTLTAVPLTTRNLTQVLSMSSGSAANVNNAGLLGAGSQDVNVNGSTAVGLYTIDGAASASTVPNPDTISEFKIQNSQYDAGYGTRVPNTNLVTRSGENEFHGDVWEFVRNDIFNANSFFQNANGRPKATLKQNQFGGTLGGPIKKDKLLFFGSYQGTRQVNGLDNTASLDTVILPPLTNDRSAATIGAQFCPANKPANVRPAYLTFAGGVQVACDGSNINPVALKLLQLQLPDGSYLIPTPQTILSSGVNAGLGLSAFSLKSIYDETQSLASLSYVLSKKHTLAARLYYATAHTDRAFGSSFLRAPETPPTPGFPVIQDDTNLITSAQLSSVLTPNIANEARMTFTVNRADPTLPGLPSASSVGMTPANALAPRLPDIIMRGPLGDFQAGNVLSDFLNYSKTFSWADTLSWTHGRQTTRTGVFALIQPLESSNISLARGRLAFQNFTDFLLGMSAAQNGSPHGLSNIQSIEADEGTGPTGNVILLLRYNHIAAFLEDDIKVTGRLTLNFGLRWEYLPSSFGRTHDLGNAWTSLLQTVPIPSSSGTYAGITVPPGYDPNQINPYTGQPFGPPPPGVPVRPNNGYYENGAPWDAFAPRFSFAWQPGSRQSRLAVRGGYGWFYQPLSDRGNATGTPSENIEPFAQLIGSGGASNGASTLQNPFPPTMLGFTLRTPTSHLDDRIIGPHFENPKLQQWNMNVQYAFSKNLTLDLGYVGSHGNDLFLLHGSNQPLLATPGHPINCGLPNTAAGLGVTPAVFAALGVDASGCVTTNTSTNSYLRVPIVGETPTGLLAHQYLGGSWYHSAQATLRQQVTHRLSFQFAYTFSKAEANTTVYNDQNNLALDWAPTAFDRTHRVITNFSYDMPSLTRPGFLGAASRGWSISGIVIVQSGTPMTLTDKNGSAVYGFAGIATVTLCPGATYSDLLTPGATTSRLHSWFNKSAVCPVPAIGTDGSSGYGDTGQGIVRGPDQFNTDASIGKTTTVGGLRENAQLAFRAEFYNALNHPQFANPGTNFGTASFGVITQTSVAPRLIQFALKYIF
jgi:Carboxypeptidase regulatory-like domain/TonB dependent receptor